MTSSDELKKLIRRLGVGKAKLLLAEVENEAQPPAPYPAGKINWGPVIQIAKNICEDVHEQGYIEDDGEVQQHLYKAVMTAVFGENYFAWEHKRTY